jgi:periplasmic protein TonB
MTIFQRQLMAQLDRAKRYPPAAQQRRAQGVAYLRFTMDRSGKVLATVLERSSGHEDLDAEVLALIKRADPLPAFPPEMAQDRLELVVPVQFSLR